MRAAVLLLVSLLTGAPQPSLSPHHKPLELAVAPLVCQAPCDLRVSVRVEPHELNRWLVVQADGPMFQGTQKQLDGAQSPATQPFIWFKGLRPGTYQVVAVLFRAQSRSEVARAVKTIEVAGLD